MTMSGALKVVLLAGLVSFLDLETVVDSAGTDSLGVVGSAEERGGGPPTPVRLAGVARRTTRRCAAGVYNC
jgi:hypothetical protein